MSEAKIYPIHPACAKWPRPSAADFNTLVEDIRAKGLLNSVWLTPADEILEGKIRYEACLQAGVEPRFEIYTGDDPIGFTISHNKLRRHLSKNELAFIGDELAKLKLGTNQYQTKVDSLASESTSQGKIAQQLGISKRSLEEVRAIKKYGEPNIIEFAKSGQVGLQGAASYARHTSHEEQRGADRNSVKKQGYALRTPLKNGINSKRKTTTKAKKLLTTEFSSEQLQELNEKLRPLIKRLREQSKRPIVAFNPIELGMIASEFERCLARWANDGSEVVGPMLRPAVSNKTSGK